MFSRVKDKLSGVLQQNQGGQRDSTNNVDSKKEDPSGPEGKLREIVRDRPFKRHYDGQHAQPSGKVE